jgi:hypothetical protein
MVALLAAPSRLSLGNSVSAMPRWHGRKWFARAFASGTVVVLLSAFMQWCHQLCFGGVVGGTDHLFAPLG